MAFSHTITLGWASGADSLSQTITKTTDGEDNRDIVFTGTATTHALVTLDSGALSCLYLLSDQNITVKTNDAGSPDDTIALVANQPKLWLTELGYSSPVTADVTDLYIINLGETGGTLKLRALQDSTP